ncbi:hypothetical protein MOO46_05235 [Apilactobacillus apisilvae]|uniref:Uncharacterized protein n=1 Tax=Apilactobacillus apisilvae TaxID=2923364 RepID=A0ABY4PGL6_9LACO|nr:hypothetical protein [Apilactobacillus apisilvae]UQS84654.1 hypothetical protein MOO46_05235 [Apilactobacillus apisilvae]
MYNILDININGNMLALPADDRLIKMAIQGKDNENYKNISNDNGDTLSADKSTDEYINAFIELNHFIKTYHKFFIYSKLFEDAKNSNDTESAAKFKKIAIDNKPALAKVNDKYVKNDLVLDLFKQQSDKLK